MSESNPVHVYRSAESGPSAVIAGTGKYVGSILKENSFWVDGQPWYLYDAFGNKLIDNETKEPKKLIFTSEQMITDRSGVVKGRAWSLPDENAEYMAIKAAEEALDDAGIKASELEGIIVATISQKKRFGSLAQQVQLNVGAVNARNVYDLSAACAGFCYALDDATANIVYKGQGPYLVIGVEDLSKMLDLKGRDGNTHLFGSGAGAVVVAPENQAGRGVLASLRGSDPFNGQNLHILHDWYSYHPDHDTSIYGYVRMPNGKSVFKLAGRVMAESAFKLNDALKWEKKNGIYVPHQANDRITDTIEGQYDLKGNVIHNIDGHGNMSSTTMPIALHDGLKDGRIKKGDKVRIMGLGGSYVWAANAIQL